MMTRSEMNTIAKLQSRFLILVAGFEIMKTNIGSEDTCLMIESIIHESDVLCGEVNEILDRNGYFTLTVK